MRVAGAAYLLYLGVCSFFDAPFTSLDGERRPSVSPLRSYLQGCTVEGANPKTVAFFIALVPQIIASAHTRSIPLLIAFCLIVPVTALPIDASIGLSGGLVAEKISHRPRLGRFLNYLASAVLVGLSALVAFG